MVLHERALRASTARTCEYDRNDHQLDARLRYGIHLPAVEGKSGVYRRDAFVTRIALTGSRFRTAWANMCSSCTLEQYRLPLSTFICSHPKRKDDNARGSQKNLRRKCLDAFAKILLFCLFIVCNVTSASAIMISRRMSDPESNEMLFMQITESSTQSFTRIRKAHLGMTLSDGHDCISQRVLKSLTGH